ncbi:MAG: NifU family protein [Nitrospira sp.]|nr:NifU family protein [bacterium]MBL7048105.1 NifU family protein [Nitrospira sp.]
MNDITQAVNEVLHNLNWLLESHESSVELVEIQGKKVILKCEGTCASCETDCVGVAFKEKIPDVELVFQ